MKVKLNQQTQEPPRQRRVSPKDVRWKKGKDDHWCKGKLIDINDKDGSLLIVEEYTGGLRSIMPEYVETLEEGPRGGKRWTRMDKVV